MKKHNTKLNRLVYSAVALTLVIAVFATATFSWLKANYVTNLETNDYFTISADAGLEMNYGDEDNNQGSINIENIKLSECSSVDGRNFFFPLSNYAEGGDGDFAEGVDTSDLVFREGTANDENKKYISVDFTLSSQSATSVWLSNESRIYCEDASNKTANAIRISFVENKPGGKTTIFDNSTSIEYAEKNNAVKTVSANGEMTETAVCDVRSFGEFVFGNDKDNVLFNIAAGETLKVTMNIWLEGTDADCVESVLDLNDLNIFVKFSTSFEEVRTIYFVDQTVEKWVDDDVDNGKCYVFAIDDHGIHHRMAQSTNYQSDYTWYVSLPEGTETLRFVRYNPDTYVDNKEYNYWEAGTVGTCSTYVAIGHSAGIWSENFDRTTLTLLDGTPNGYLRQDDCEIHLMYSVTDGNGTVQNFDYKMSYQNENYRWQITIPSNADNISFKRMNNAQTTTYETWTNLGSRGDNHYVTLNTSSTGYWGNQIVYIEDTKNVKGDDAVFAIYFFAGDNDSSTKWTALRAHFTPSGGKLRHVAVVPAGKTMAVVTRYNPSATTWGWDSSLVYNQTDDHRTGFASVNLFKTSDWTGDGRLKGAWYNTDTTW